MQVYQLDIDKLTEKEYFVSIENYCCIDNMIEYGMRLVLPCEQNLAILCSLIYAN